MSPHLILLPFLLLLLSPTSTVGLFRSDPRVDTAIKRATAFILSRRHPDTLEWSRNTLETAAALLGLTSGDPLWRIGEDQPDQRKAEVAQTVTALKLALAESLLKSDGKLDSLDDSTLAQFVSAFQASCVDPTSVLGQDLVAEATRRLEGTLQRSPSLPGLSLPLCLQGVRVPLKTVKLLTMPKRGNSVVCESLCVERAALNIATLSCMFKQEEVYPTRFRTTIVELLRENIAFIEAKRDQKDYQPNFFDTSLLLQANDVSPVPLNIPTDELFAAMLSYQKADGSYGGSVSLTALAIPALSHFNALDILSIKCKKAATEEITSGPQGEWGTVFYKITDVYLNTQTLIGEFNATLKGGKHDLNNVFSQFHDSNPALFWYETKQTPFGINIDVLGGIPSNPVSAWNVYVVRPDDAAEVEEKVQDLRSVDVSPGMKVIFKYEKV